MHNCLYISSPALLSAVSNKNPKFRPCLSRDKLMQRVIKILLKNITARDRRFQRSSFSFSVRFLSLRILDGIT